MMGRGMWGGRRPGEGKGVMTQAGDLHLCEEGGRCKEVALFVLPASML